MNSVISYTPSCDTRICAWHVYLHLDVMAADLVSNPDTVTICQAYMLPHVCCGVLGIRCAALVVTWVMMYLVHGQGFTRSTGSV